MSSPIGSFLCPPEYAGPNGLRALGRESAVALEAYRGTRRRRDDRARRGSWARAGRVAVNEPVLMVPGFLAGDWSLRRMALFLRESGWRTYRSGIGVNAGCTTATGEQLERRLEAVVARRGRPASIVGHSLGGLLARGLAARRPDLVAGIVTLGSPVLAPGAVHGLLGWHTDVLTRLARAGFASAMSDDCVAGACARQSWEAARAALPVHVGFTAVYSQHDGIVDWRSCLDPAARHVEVTSSHLGMAVDPTVLDVVAAALVDQRLSRATPAAAPSDGVDPLRAGSR